MSKLIIEFPNDLARESFLAWLADGGGEQEFFQSEEIHCEEGRDAINSMDYKLAFPAWGWDPAKHGPDKVVVAQTVKDES
jgi:hypothetical protein